MFDEARPLGEKGLYWLKVKMLFDKKCVLPTDAEGDIGV